MDKTEELTEDAKGQVEGVIMQARSVINNAKSIAKAAERQVEALGTAKTLLPRVEEATEQALASLR